jgi:competence protein ComEC
MLSVGATHFWMNDSPVVESLRLRRIPLLAAALCFAAGELIAHQWQPTRLLIISTLTLLLLAIVALHRSSRIAAIPTFALWIVVGCWCTQIQPPIPQQQSLQSYADGLSRNVQGRIVRMRTLPTLQTSTETQQLAPWQIEPGGWETEAAPPRQSIDLDVTAVEDITPDVSTMRPIKGGVRVILVGNELALHCGDLIEIPLRLRTPDIYRDPGADSYATELLNEGIGVTASAKSAKVTQLGDSAPTWRCKLYAVQTWAAKRLDTFVASRPNRLLPAALQLSAEDTAMLNAMLFGNRTALTQSLRDAFQRTGTFHLFVVSGLHVVLLAAALSWTLRGMRLPEGPTVILTITTAAAYTLLAGFGVPAQRALLMTSLYLIARWLDRETNALNALGFSALVVLALDPRALFEASFQMTFLVIVAIAGIASPVIHRSIGPHARALRNLEVINIDAFMHPKLAQFRVRIRMVRDIATALLGNSLSSLPVWLLKLMYYLADAMIISIVAELCMVIPMAIYFHRATILALPLNLLNIPLLSALLCSAVVMFCTSLLSPWLAFIPSVITAFLLHIMRFTVARLQHSPLGDLRIPAPVPIVLVLACIAITLSCFLLRERRPFLVAIGVILAMMVPLAVLYPAPPLLFPARLEVTALDVGQGDSLLVVSPEGETMLLDAGGPVGRAANAPVSGWDIGEQVVAPYLWSRRIRKLDIVVLTHAHSDHMGGMSAVLRDMHPRELWLSIEPGNSPGLLSLIDEANRMHITVRHLHAGDTPAFGSVQTTVLAPEIAYTNPGAPVNDDSLVLRLDYDKASVLLEGDAELRSEDAMLLNQRLAPVTLLKVGHHGSKTSTNPEFLSAVTPKEAVISVGRHNTFGHPRGEVLARLEAAHIKTIRTDRAGAETFLLTHTGDISNFSAASSE